MDKKGEQQSWGQIITAIITIVVIIVILFIIVPQLKEPALKLLGLGSELTKSTSELAVTEAEYAMTVQKSVSNSANALACAINSISAGQATFTDTNCMKPYGLYAAELPKRTAGETDYSQKIGNLLLECFKNYKPTEKEITSLPCCSISPEANDFEVKAGEIQKYLEVLEKTKDEYADDLAGGALGIGKEYTITLSGNMLKKDSIICGYNNKVILTDDRIKCGMIEETKCGAGERQYGTTCVKCEEEELICCNYCEDSNCEWKSSEWMREEDCNKLYLGSKGEKVDSQRCEIQLKLKEFETKSIKCSISDFYLPAEADVEITPEGSSLVVKKQSSQLKKEMEGAKFNLLSSAYDLISMDVSKPGGIKDKRQADIISPCKAELEIKEGYCKGKIYNDEYVLKYEKEGKTYLQPVEPLSLKNQERFSYWDSMPDEEKIKALKGTDAVANNGFAMAIAGDTTIKRASDLVKNNKELMKDSILLYFAPNMNYFINHMLNAYYWAFAKANNEDILRTQELNFFCKIGWPIPPAEEGWLGYTITAEPNCQNYNFKTLTDTEYKAFISYAIDFYFSGKENLNNLQFYYKFNDGAEIKITDAQQVAEMYNALDVVFSTELSYWPTAKETVDEYANFLNGKALTICSNQDYYYQQICSSYGSYFRTEYKGEKNMLEYLGKEATYGFTYFGIGDVTDISQLKKIFTEGYEHSDRRELKDWQEVQKEGGKLVVKEAIVPCISIGFKAFNPNAEEEKICYTEARDVIAYSGATQGAVMGH
jgi:hypothetical protein